MTKLFTTALAAIMAITLLTHAPTQAHAGTKERALVAGLVAGAAVAAAVMMKSKAKKVYRSAKSNVYPNDECGPGFRMKRGHCVSRYTTFKGGKKFSKFRSGKKFSKRFGSGKKFKAVGFKKRPSWQLQAISKGCKPGLAWNKYEGCHEND